MIYMYVCTYTYTHTNSYMYRMIHFSFFSHIFFVYKYRYVYTIHSAYICTYIRDIITHARKIETKKFRLINIHRLTIDANVSLTSFSFLAWRYFHLTTRKRQRGTARDGENGFYKREITPMRWSDLYEFIEKFRIEFAIAVKYRKQFVSNNNNSRNWMMLEYILT